MSTTFSSAPASVSREYKPFTPGTKNQDQGTNVKEKDQGSKKKESNVNQQGTKSQKKN